ncbi:hypothetical protein GYH30_052044 [Glycine max]|nr:hypothetical protein GYH30_052044 [Glycine max]
MTLDLKVGITKIGDFQSISINHTESVRESLASIPQ